MVQNPPDGYQRVIPYLSYRDAPAAIDYLCRTFGFEERFRMPGPDGAIGHAELSIHGEVVMLATAVDEMGMSTPDELGKHHALVMVYVDDVDAHHARAVAAGAASIGEPETKFYGDRSYQAKDPEGHTWYFAQHVRDVSPEEMGGQTK
jgi:PhnB protein